MKHTVAVILLSALVFSTYAQESEWHFLENNTSDAFGKFSIWYQDPHIHLNNKEGWTKVLFKQPERLARKDRHFRGVSYMLQYTTVDCDADRISYESTRVYNSKGKLLNVPLIDLVSSFYKPILPGTIDADMWQAFCG